jgi:hypothetical protein
MSVSLPDVPVNVAMKFPMIHCLAGVGVLRYIGCGCGVKRRYIVLFYPRRQPRTRARPRRWFAAQRVTCEHVVGIGGIASGIVSDLFLVALRSFPPDSFFVPGCVGNKH